MADITADGPLPPAGTYHIISRILSPEGYKMVITFNGEGLTATVTRLSSSRNTQLWTITDFDSSTQTITPVSAGNLQAAGGSGYVTVLPAQDFVWRIRQTASGYTIQDSGETVFWAINHTKVGSEVTIEQAKGGSEKQRWILEKVVVN